MSKREPMSIGAFGRWCFIAMLAASLLCAIVSGLVYRHSYVLSDRIAVEVRRIGEARLSSPSGHRGRQDWLYDVHLLAADGREVLHAMERPWQVGEIHVVRVHRMTLRVVPNGFKAWMPSAFIGAWAVFAGAMYFNIRRLERKEAVEAAQGES